MAGAWRNLLRLLVSVGIVTPCEAAPAPRPKVFFQKTIKERSSLQHEIDMGADTPAGRKPHVEIHRLQASPSLDVEVAPEAHLKTAFRARANIPRKTGEKESYEVEATNLTLEQMHQYGKVSLGLQEISWGDTFGLTAADVVNPRDYREPLFYDPSLTRIPLAMANVQLFVDDWDMQLVAVPLPRTEPGMADYQWFRDFEGGGRMGYRFGSLALQAQYYFHWNREPLVVLRGSPLSPEPSWYQSRVRTYGLSFSDGFYDLVLRGDVMMHQGVPAAQKDPFADPARHDELQSILGVDWAGDSGWMLSAQLHADVWTRKAQTKKQSEFYWIGLRFKDSYFQNAIEVSAFVMSGLGSRDVWLKPTLIWNATNSWRMEIEGNVLDGDDSGAYPQLFKQQSHLTVRTSYSY